MGLFTHLEKGAFMKSKVGVWIDHSRAIIMIKIGRNWSRNEIMASMGNYNMMQMNGTSNMFSDTGIDMVMIRLIAIIWST